MKSGGIINKDRAIKAAELTLSSSIEEAIRASREIVADQVRKRVNKNYYNAQAIGVLPLPSTFDIK